MPFFDASKRQECIVDTLDAITMIKMMIDAHPLHSIIIGGDFNCELKGGSPFDSYWDELKDKFDLISCESLLSNQNSYTYSHDTLTDNHLILNEGDNPSDHLPFLFTLSLPLSDSVQPTVNETSLFPYSFKPQERSYTGRGSILVFSFYN